MVTATVLRTNAVQRYTFEVYDRNTLVAFVLCPGPHGSRHVEETEGRHLSSDCKCHTQTSANSVGNDSMQSFSINHGGCANLHSNSIAGPRLPRSVPRLPKRAAAITQAGLFGLNFGTASSTDVKTQKQEVKRRM